MDQAIAVVVPVLYGYLLALVVSLVFTFGIAKLMRPALVSGGYPLVGYHVVSGMAWFITALAGCWIAGVKAPFSPAIYIVGMDVILGIFLLNVTREVGSQQKRATVISTIAGFLLGTIAAWYIVLP